MLTVRLSALSLSLRALVGVPASLIAFAPMPFSRAAMIANRSSLFAVDLLPSCSFPTGIKSVHSMPSACIWSYAAWAALRAELSERVALVNKVSAALVKRVGIVLSLFIMIYSFSLSTAWLLLMVPIVTGLRVITIDSLLSLYTYVYWNPRIGTIRYPPRPHAPLQTDRSPVCSYITNILK